MEHRSNNMNECSTRPILLHGVPYRFDTLGGKASGYVKFECVRYDVKESVMCDVCLCDNCAACSSYSCANTYYIEEEIKFNVLLMRRAAHHRAVVRAPRHRFEHVVGSFVQLLYLLCTCIVYVKRRTHCHHQILCDISFNLMRM